MLPRTFAEATQHTRNTLAACGIDLKDLGPHLLSTFDALQLQVLANLASQAWHNGYGLGEQNEALKHNYAAALSDLQRDQLANG